MEAHGRDPEAGRTDAQFGLRLGLLGRLRFQEFVRDLAGVVPVLVAHQVGPSGFATRRASDKPVITLVVGDRVTHDQFGLGTVMEVKGAGEDAQATIDFGDDKPKRLLLRYAPVQKL